MARMSSQHTLPQSSSSSGTTGNIEHVCQLSEDFAQLHNSEDYSDLTLVVAGQKFHAHKIVLAARSQYFRALLFGGLKESSQREVELKDASLAAFKGLLKYIYTGRISLADRREEVVLDILGLAHLYGFLELEASILDYLREILSIRNVCSIYDAALLYRLEFLTNVCLEFMDNHATAIIEHESFLQLSCAAVNKLISRDSFYAPEIEIFLAIQSWVKANPESDKDSVLSKVKLSLMMIEELLDIVRPTELVSSEAILDAIAARTHAGNLNLEYRGRLVVDENVADLKHGATVLQGEMRSFLLDGDTRSYDMERGYTRHMITDSQEYGIVIKLGTQCIINHVKMLLWDRDLRSYSYYMEVSMDQRDWVRVVDHREYYCRSWQYLYFEPRVVLYIRIVGTNNTVNKVFHVVSFEAYYTNHMERIQDGFVVPTKNVATLELRAVVVEGVSRSRNCLLNGNTSKYDWEGGYTCHQLGSGSILLQLAQPYIIDSMRLLLWDRDSRSYSYYIEVSGNSKNWTLVADKTRENCRSWQTIRFSPPRPVVLIKIVGTQNTANEVFHCVHFECPAQIDDDSSSSCSSSKSSLHQCERRSSSPTIHTFSNETPETATEAMNIDREDRSASN